ncbi:SAM-dependent DNA methyltransferase [Dysgonomonas sp. 520]|nr:SAM-dependent DNA methyltransferase [Dysgonomonas sp. 520]
MYPILENKIAQSERASINEKILNAIQWQKKDFSKEEIYNSYTGIGGLHNLNMDDYANYNEYAEAKREFEMGQFFTPHKLCRTMVELVSPEPSELILDMCCDTLRPKSRKSRNLSQHNYNM